MARRKPTLVERMRDELHVPAPQHSAALDAVVYGPPADAQARDNARREALRRTAAARSRARRHAQPRTV
jgi:hypothetical protein